MGLGFRVSVLGFRVIGVQRVWFGFHRVPLHKGSFQVSYKGSRVLQGARAFRVL